jgi:sterol desaturase/sphingolipid hydroxylase (fatty acid hydroxylase superfamily)
MLVVGDRLPVVVAVTFMLLLLLERLRPLRRSVESKPRRVARNLAVGAISFAVTFPLQLALLVPLSRWVTARHVGLLQTMAMPWALRVALAAVLLDYTLWIWHWASHRVPFLWRFHLVHHVDRDLDASTALRFHFGELALSVAYRAAQVVVIGADPAAVWIWQIVLFVSILFHHANVRLPRRWERLLVRLVVTPRMHGIHHADREERTNSNWSSILTCWDYLHGTILLDVPDEEIAIGVPAYAGAREVTLGRLLLLPFRRRRDDWSRAGVVHGT